MISKSLTKEIETYHLVSKVEKTMVALSVLAP